MLNTLNIGQSSSLTIFVMNVRSSTVLNFKESIESTKNDCKHKDI